MRAWPILVILPFLLGASPQINSLPRTDKDFLIELTNLNELVQDKKFRVLRTTPTIIELPKGEVALVVMGLASTGTVSLFFNIDNSTYSVPLKRN